MSKKTKDKVFLLKCYQNHQEKVRSNLGVTRFRKCDTTAADNEAICCKMANVQIILSKFSTFENVSHYLNLTFLVMISYGTKENNYQSYLTMLHISKKKNEMFLNLLI